jgi:hypothetical protein
MGSIPRMVELIILKTRGSSYTRPELSQGKPPMFVINISIWNDGVSGVRSKRWNPFEVWTVTLAGLSRKVCMLNIMSLTCGDNFHPSQNFFLAAGRHIKAARNPSI